MIYIFDQIELYVLLAAKGLTSIYSFDMEKEPEPEQIYYAVYQLTKGNVLEQEGDQLVMKPPISEFAAVIRQAKHMVSVERGGYRIPGQCLYAGADQLVCLESSPTSRNHVGLTGDLNLAAVFLQMQELDQLPEAKVTEDMGAFDFENYWEIHLADSLRALLDGGLSTEIEGLLDEGQVHTVFSLRDTRSGELIARMILVELPLEYGVVIQTGDQVLHYRYVQSETFQILENWLLNP